MERLAERVSQGSGAVLSETGYSGIGVGVPRLPIVCAFREDVRLVVDSSSTHLLLMLSAQLLRESASPCRGRILFDPPGHLREAFPFGKCLPGTDPTPTYSGTRLLQAELQNVIEVQNRKLQHKYLQQTPSLSGKKYVYRLSLHRLRGITCVWMIFSQASLEYIMCVPCTPPGFIFKGSMEKAQKP